MEPGRAESSRRFWHTTPLHYAPYLLLTGRLYAQTRLKELSLPVKPRRTATRRDQRLRLDGYVHLSRSPQTPLLRDKLQHGWPHVLLEFDETLFELPGTAVIPYNTKSWRHRDDFIPVIDAVEREEILSGPFRSPELLIRDALPLNPYALALHTISGEEAAWLAGLIPLTGLPGGLPIRVSPQHFPAVAIPLLNRSPFVIYAEACRAAGRLLPPPDLPFD